MTDTTRPPEPNENESGENDPDDVSQETESSDVFVERPPSSEWNNLLHTEDWWAVWIGAAIFAVALIAMLLARPSGAIFSENAERLTEVRAEINEIEAEIQKRENLQEAEEENGKPPSADLQNELAEFEILRNKLFDEGKEIREFLSKNPLKGKIAKLDKWKQNPLEAFGTDGSTGAVNYSKVVPVIFVGLFSLVLFAMGAHFMGEPPQRFAIAFIPIFLLALLSYLLASQSVIKSWNLEYPLWALMIGLLISNTIGTPSFLKPGVRTEFYIKTGLVLLGAKILLNQLVVLGIPGIFVSWVVTPIVLVSTYLFGQWVLKITSKSLNMTISADMSVCGVSAAIATAAACKAKKEELSLAIGLSLSFTVIMMFVMPLIIGATGMSPTLGGAWMGGTIDATGAVAAAGAMLGDEGEQAAITIKMIQNVLIGVIAFFVAIYWVTYVERNPDSPKPDAWEIWRRFPKFIIGFIAASIIFTLVASSMVAGKDLVISMYKGTTDVFRGWFFCMAFVSIGLETNFKELAKQMQGGKPLILYVVGQSLNLILTLAMAYLMFEVVFPNSF